MRKPLVITDQGQSYLSFNSDYKKYSDVDPSIGKRYKLRLSNRHSHVRANALLAPLERANE